MSRFFVSSESDKIGFFIRGADPSTKKVIHSLVYLDDEPKTDYIPGVRLAVLNSEKNDPSYLHFPEIHAADESFAINFKCSKKNKKVCWPRGLPPKKQKSKLIWEGRTTEPLEKYSSPINNFLSRALAHAKKRSGTKRLPHEDRCKRLRTLPPKKAKAP
jgi:hypothetical protein